MKLPVNTVLYRILKLLGFPVIWEKSVGAVLFCTRSGRREYLILRYPSGHYEFPRGHAEVGETEEETLRREVREETGIGTLNMYPFRTENRFFYVAHGSERVRRIREGRGVWIFKCVFFYPACTEEIHVSLSHEHQEWLWLPYDEAVRTVTYVNAKSILERTERYLNERATVEQTEEIKGV